LLSSPKKYQRGFDRTMPGEKLMAISYSLIA
jgi:hypothetical protein